MQTIVGDAAGYRSLRMGPGGVLLLVIGVLVGLQLMLLDGPLALSRESEPARAAVQSERATDHAYTLPYRVAHIRASSEPAEAPLPETAAD